MKDKFTWKEGIHDRIRTVRVVKAQHVSKLVYCNLNTWDIFMNCRNSKSQEAHACGLSTKITKNANRRPPVWLHESPRHMTKHVTKLVWCWHKCMFRGRSVVKSQHMNIEQASVGPPEYTWPHDRIAHDETGVGQTDYVHCTWHMTEEHMTNRAQSNLNTWQKRKP